MSEILKSPPYEEYTEIEVEKSTKEKKSLIKRIGKVAAIGVLTISGIVITYGDTKRSDQVKYFHEDNQQTIGESMTIMTANVHSWNGLSGNNFNKLKSVVERKEPDVICMQEVLSGGNELKELYDMGYDVFFHATRDFPLITSQGNAIASLVPMHNINTVSLPSSRTLIPREAIITDVKADNKKIRVSNLHLDTENAGSDTQIKYLSLM